MDRERWERDTADEAELRREQEQVLDRGADRQAERWLRREEADAQAADRQRLALQSRDELRDLELAGKVEYTDRVAESVDVEKLVIDPRDDADRADRLKQMMRETNRAGENRFLDRQPALDEIDKDPELRTMAVHSTADDPIEVLDYKGNYFVEEGSFERVRMAREMGAKEVPVQVRRAEIRS